MNIEQLQSQITKELRIQKNNLENEAAQNPLLISKYLNMLWNVQREWDQLSREYDEKLPIKYMEYKKNGFKGYAVTTQREFQVIIDGDTELNDLKARIKARERLINYLKEVVENFRARGFAIKNMIDIIKFLEGTN